MRLWHGSPTGPLKWIEPKSDKRTGEIAIFTKKNPVSAMAYAILPSRHDSIVNYTTEKGRFIEGSVLSSEPVLSEGWLYEFDAEGDEVKDSYLIRQSTKPVSARKITRREIENAGWEILDPL